jgi:hypothetical protein
VDTQLNACPPHLIFCEYGLTGVLRSPIAEEFRVPVVVQFHGYDSGGSPVTAWLSLLDCNTGRIVDAAQQEGQFVLGDVLIDRLSSASPMAIVIDDKDAAAHEPRV